MLNFIAEHHIAIIDAVQPIDFPSRLFPLQRQHDALNTVSDLNADGVEVHAARLLEIGELRDLLPIQPDFPAQTPGAKRRRLPIIFDEADIMLALVDAQCLQRSQIQLLRIARIRLQDHLILVILLHAIGILSEASVIGAHRRFDISDAPGFRTEHAQGGRRIARPGADLHIIGRPD